MAFAFAFRFTMSGTIHTTSYSPENNERLFQAFNAGDATATVFHQIVAGSNAGQIAEHTVNFSTRSVTTTTGHVSTLVLQRS
jgi:hypothetical protein